MPIFITEGDVMMYSPRSTVTEWDHSLFTKKQKQNIYALKSGINFYKRGYIPIWNTYSGKRCRLDQLKQKIM